MGPLQKSARGNEYVLIIIDGFTKFAIVEPMKNQRAWTVAQLFVDRCITKFGCPSVMSSDQGRQFVGQVFAELSEIIGFQHICSAAYHQAGNGQAERMVQVVKTMLLPYVTENGQAEKDWDRYIHTTTFAYNNSVHTSTGETPFYLCHGFDPLTPLDNCLKIGKTEIVDPSSSGFKEFLATNIRHAWDRAKTAITKAQKSQKYNYDKKANFESNLKIGDLVLFKVQNPSKFEQRWSGPHRVIRVARPNVVIEKSGKIFETHLNLVKKFHTACVLPLRSVKVKKFVKEWSSESEQDEIESTSQKGQKKKVDKNLESSESESAEGEDI
jgi:hypothetical protein